MYFLGQIKTQFIAQLASYQVAEGVEEPSSFEGEKSPSEDVSKPSSLKEVEGIVADASKTAQAIDADVDRATAQRVRIAGDNPLSFGEGTKSEINTFSQNPEGLEMGELASLGNEEVEREEFSLGERVISPEEKALLERFKAGEVTADDPGISALAEELGMEEVLRTAHIDGLEKGEIAEGIEESTPEMLEGSKAEIEAEQRKIEEQISSLPEGSAERQQLEQRSGLLGGFLSSIEHALNPQNDGVPFSGVDVVGDRNVIARGMAHEGIHERTGKADKFLMGMARSARETPWCAGFVSYVLTEAGYNITPTLSSKAFINETGKGHVAFYAGNGQMLGGNQADKVSIAPIRKPIQGWIMPEDLEAGRPPQRGGTPPIGAVIVFNRGGADRNMR